MEIKTIGEVIFRLRTKRHIAREDLCRGLCSSRTLVRIERGEQSGNKWVLEALLGRMGKTAAHMEYYLGEKEFGLQKMRVQIKKAYHSGEIEAIPALLEKYENNQGAGKSLHRQFVFKMKALIFTEDEWEKRLYCLKEALLCTVPQFYKKAIRQLYLSEEEIYIIILIACTYEKSGNYNKAYLLRCGCYEYLCHAQISEEMKLRCLPFLALSIAKQAKDRLDIKMWKETTNETIKLLKKNRLLYTLPDMLILREAVMKFEVCSEEKQKYYEKELRYAAILREIQEEYEDTVYTGFNRPSCLTEHSGYRFIGEYIRTRRLALHMTQSELTQNELVCTIRQLSNIETGKSKPDEYLYHELMKGLGVDESFYESYVDTSNFALDEKRFQLDRYITQRKLSEAETLLQEIKSEQTGTKADLQYILFLQTMLDVQLRLLSPAIAMKYLEQALSYSIGDYKNQDYAKWSLSRNEVKILNSIAILHAELGNMELAIHIFYELKRHYDKDGTDIPRHLQLYELILNNLTKYLGLQGRHKDAIAIAEKGIQICMKSGNINFLPVFLYAKVWNMEKYLVDVHDICKKYLKQAYVLSVITEDAEKQRFIISYYQEKYNETLQFDEAYPI